MGKQQLAVPIGGIFAVAGIPASAVPPTAANINAEGEGRSPTVLNTARLTLPETGVQAYAVKGMTANGKVRVLTVDGAGDIFPGAEKVLFKAEALARWKHYGSLRPRLFDHLQTEIGSTQRRNPPVCW